MKGEGHTVLDIVPVDVVVNLLISSAWYTGLNKKKEMIIYHCTTGGLHPFRWGEMGLCFYFLIIIE
jgi:alcohol-forming fatty acyl-CoA reductase